MTNRTPQPGAQPGNAHLPYEDVAGPASSACFTLSKSDAINFVSAEPALLPENTLLWRVFGGGAYDTGSYWSPNRPDPTDTEAEWRGSKAVEFSWNSGTSVCSLKGGANGLWSWRGMVAAQPAQDDAGRYLPGYLLPGGGQQLKLPPNPTHTKSDPGNFTISDVGDTPWHTPAAAPTPGAAPAVAANAMAGTKFAALSSSLSDLSVSLAGPAAEVPSGSERARAAIQTQAQVLRLHHADLVAAAGRLPDPEAQAEVQHLLRAFRGLRRHLVLDHHAEAEQTLARVIHQAHSLI